MQAIRIKAVGLIIAALLIRWSATEFVHGAALGMVEGDEKMIVTLAFILACLGMGMFISATIYALIDSLVCGLVDATCEVVVAGADAIYNKIKARKTAPAAIKN